MIASSVSRQRYREYTQFLRESADRLNMSIAPSRLQALREQVSAERNKFLAWQVVWMLIAVVSGAPLLMLIAAQAGLPLPGPLDARADDFLDQVSDGGAARFTAVVSGIMFWLATAVAYAPVIAYSGALADLEQAHRALKQVEKL